MAGLRGDIVGKDLCKALGISYNNVYSLDLILWPKKLRRLEFIPISKRNNRVL